MDTLEFDEEQTGRNSLMQREEHLTESEVREIVKKFNDCLNKHSHEQLELEKRIKAIIDKIDDKQDIIRRLFKQKENVLLDNEKIQLTIEKVKRQRDGLEQMRCQILGLKYELQSKMLTDDDDLILISIRSDDVEKEDDNQEKMVKLERERFFQDISQHDENLTKEVSQDLLKRITELEQRKNDLLNLNSSLKDRVIKKYHDNKFQETKCSNCRQYFLPMSNQEGACHYHPGKQKFFSCRGCGADQYYICCNKCANNMSAENNSFLMQAFPNGITRNVVVGQTIIQIEAEIPGLMNVSVKGRFRVQERNIGSANHNASGEDHPLHFSNSDHQNLMGAVANIEISQDQQDITNQRHSIQAINIDDDNLNQVQHEEGNHQSNRLNDHQLEIVEERQQEAQSPTDFNEQYQQHNRLSYQQPAISGFNRAGNHIDTPNSSSRHSHNQNNNSSGYGANGGLIHSDTNGMSGGATSRRNCNGGAAELVLSSQKSKSYSGYFRIREKLNESSESNQSGGLIPLHGCASDARLFLDQADDTSSLQSPKDRRTPYKFKNKRLLQDSLKRNRLESDDNLADKEDNNLDVRKNSKPSHISPSSNHSEVDTQSLIQREDMINDFQNRLAMGSASKDPLQQQSETNDLNGITNGQQVVTNSVNQFLNIGQLNRVQEDHENEADESSACGDDHRHHNHHQNKGRNHSGNNNRSKSFEQGDDNNDENVDEEETKEQLLLDIQNSKDDSYFYENQDQQPFQQQMRIKESEAKEQQMVFQSEMRSDKSQADNESENEYQSISSLQNKLNRGQKIKAKDVTSKNKRDADKNLYFDNKQRTSNELNRNVSNNMVSKFEARKDTQNNSQEFLYNKYDWVKAENSKEEDLPQKSNQTQKIQLVMRTKTNFIDQDSKSGSHNPVENYENDNQKENIQNALGNKSHLMMNQQPVKIRLDSETNELINATLGQSSNNIIEIEDNQPSQNLKMDQIRLIKSKNEDSLILILDKGHKVESTQDNQQTHPTNVIPLDKDSSVKYILIIDKTGKRARYNKSDIKMTKYHNNIMLRLPTGQRILADYAQRIASDDNTYPPNTQIMVTEDRIKAMDESEESDEIDDEEEKKVAKKQDGMVADGSNCPLMKGRFLIKNSTEDKNVTQTNDSKLIQSTVEKMKKKPKAKNNNRGSDSQNSRKAIQKSQFMITLDNNEMPQLRNYHTSQQSIIGATGDQTFNTQTNMFMQQIPQQIMMNSQYLSPMPHQQQIMQQFTPTLYQSVAQSPVHNRRATIYDSLISNNMKQMMSNQQVNRFDYDLNEDQQQTPGHGKRKQARRFEDERSLEQDQIDEEEEEVKIPDSMDSKNRKSHIKTNDKESKQKFKNTNGADEHEKNHSKAQKENQFNGQHHHYHDPYLNMFDSIQNQQYWHRFANHQMMNTQLQTYPVSYQQPCMCAYQQYQMPLAAQCPMSLQTMQYNQNMNMINLFREQTHMYTQISQNLSQMMNSIIAFKTQQNREQLSSSSSSSDEEMESQASASYSERPLTANSKHSSSKQVVTNRQDKKRQKAVTTMQSETPSRVEETTSGQYVKKQFHSSWQNNITKKK